MIETTHSRPVSHKMFLLKEKLGPKFIKPFFDKLKDPMKASIRHSMVYSESRRISKIELFLNIRCKKVLILIFRLNHVFSRRFGLRLPLIFRQFVNLINHNTMIL